MKVRGRVSVSVDGPFLQPVLDALDEGVVVIDRDHVIRAVNSSIISVLEIDPSINVVGMHIRDSIKVHGDLLDLQAAEFRKEVHVRYKLVTGGYHGGGGFQTRRRTRNGRIIEMRRTPTPDGGAVINTLDVTAEVDLERRTSQLETVIQNTDDGVFQIDDEGIIELFNERMASFYRFEVADIRVGDHISKFVRYLLSVSEMTTEELETFKRIDHMNSGLDRPLIREQVIRTIWGRVFQVSRAVLPGGGAIATHRDVTALYERQVLLEQARAEAEDASRLKSEFIARVTHELRTPMHGVLGIAALLERSGLDSAQSRFLATLQRSGRHMVELIDGLLTVSTLEAGDLVLDLRESDLQVLINDSFEMLRSRADEKGLSFELETDLCDSRVMVDDTRLTQIIVNLLTNAIKFTEVGAVRVTASSILVGSMVRFKIDISDSGPGIPQAKIKQIFRKFSQLGGGQGTCNEGVGLGLAIVQSLTELMQGRLSVESLERTGTVFTLEVDLQQVAHGCAYGDAPLNTAAGARS